ncbi:glycosyltransferase family 2 protein [Saprospiraceae bacterium]|nr:glycosyltransferase family 2 protein [Saprospiraceae bacterium]
MRVTIIIRCFNEEKHIGQLLKGISKQITDHELETIVVDSGSTDDTLKIAKSYDTKIVNLKPENFSFGYALNLGCQNATGDILIFASAHVYPVYEYWIQEMTQPFSNKKIALVYGRQRGNHLTKFSEKQLFKKWFPLVSDNNQAYAFCNNANCAIRRDLWEAQNYDELLTGLEDLDWAKKIQDKGYKIAYNAKAEIVHVHEETPERIYNRYRREAIALKRILPDEKFSFFEFIKLFISNTFSDYYYAVSEGQLLKNIWDIPMFRYNQFLGTYKGYKQDQIITKSLRNRFYYPNKISNKSTSKLNEKHRPIKY